MARRAGSRSTRSVGAGTRLRPNPLDASYIIGLNASTLLSGALSSSFKLHGHHLLADGRRLVRNRRGLQVHTTLEPCGLHTAANPARSIIARISGILRIQRNGGLGSSPASQESRAHRTMASFVNPPPSHKHHLSAAYTYTLTHCARRHAPLRPTRSGPIDLIGRNLDRDEVTLRQPG